MLFNYKRNRAWAENLSIVMQIGLTMAGCIVFCFFVGLYINDFFTKYEDLFNWSKPKAGPIVFPSLRLNADVKAFCRDLVAQTGVLLLPGSLHGAGKRRQHFS